MQRALPFLAALLLLFTVAPRAGAQVTRADSAAVLLDAALSFQDRGRWEVSDALLQHILERFGDTPAAARAREALQGVDHPRGSRSDQVELQVWSTLYGAWLGVAVPASFGADDPAPYGLGLLVGGPGGFLAGRAVSRSRALSEGQVRAITFGSLWGSWQGFGWAEVLDWDESEFCDLDFCSIEDPDGEHVMRALVLGGLAGIAGGALLARKPISGGVATTVTFGGLWGTWFGVAGGGIADLDGDDLLTATLLAGNAGLLGSALAAPSWDLTRERARLISISGVLGGVAGAGLDLILQPDDEKVAVAIPLLGSLAGLGIGAAWTARDRGEAGRGSARGSDGAPPQAEAPWHPAEAVVGYREGTLRLGIPLPVPTLLNQDGPRGQVLRPALGIDLLRVRF